MLDETKIPTGSDILDKFLDGGYEKGVLTTVYGPGGSGKTNLCLLALIRMTGSEKKVIYIDTESSLSVERLKQITKYYEKVLQRTILLKPSTFQEQRKILEQQLKKIINGKIGLIIVDTISSLYRLEISQSDDFQVINSSLAKQTANLIHCARDYDLPIIITNQVYSDFKDKEKVNMVGGDIIKNSSKCLIELQSLARGRRRAYLRKHRSLPEHSFDFAITEKGIEKIK